LSSILRAVIPDEQACSEVRYREVLPGDDGRDLPIGHGAPLRARVETQLGYKSLKFLRRIVVTDRFDDHGRNGNLQNGWSWYAGI
jgi:hypothetical protein